jgi:hypothetical protein
MSRLHRLIPVFGVSLVLAACGQDITGATSRPVQPAFDGGVTSLGGNAVDPASGGGTNTGTTSTTTTTVVEGDTTSRGGVTSLGGN